MSGYHQTWRIGTGVLLGLATVLTVGGLGFPDTVALFLPITFLAAIYGLVFSSFTQLSLERVITVAVWTGVGVTCTTGLLAVLGPFALVLVALPLVSSPTVIDRAFRTAEKWRIVAASHEATDPDQDDLAQAWRMSYVGLHRAADPADKVLLVEIRASLLHELEQRCEAATGPGWEETLGQVTPVDLQATARPFGPSGGHVRRTPRRRQPG